MTAPLLPDAPRILEALREVVDPEMGVNVVDLGLIYSVDIDGGQVRIRMTLTTRNCPLHELLAQGVAHASRKVPGVVDIVVETVWDPPWHPSMARPGLWDR